MKHVHFHDHGREGRHAHSHDHAEDERSPASERRFGWVSEAAFGPPSLGRDYHAHSNLEPDLDGRDSIHSRLGQSREPRG